MRRFIQWTGIVLITILSASCVSRKVSPEKQFVHHTFEARAAAPKVKISGERTVKAGPLGKMEIHFVNVGQGDCTLIKFPNGKKLLIDCGSLGEGNPKEIQAYLQQHIPDRRLAGLVVTHPDADHYNLLPRVLADFKIEQVYTVGPAAEHDARPGTTAKWLHGFDLKILEAAEYNTKPLKRLGAFDPKVDVLVMAANVKATRSPSNARSIVLKVTHGDVDVILTGDATFDTELDIIKRFAERPDFLDVEVLKLGHHGSHATSTGKPWLSAVKPEAAVASAAITNKHGHPSESVVTNVANFTVRTAPHKFRAYRKGEGLNYDTDEALYHTVVNDKLVLTSDGKKFQISFAE